MVGGECCEFVGELPAEVLQSLKKVCVKTLASRILDEMIALLPNVRSRHADLLKFSIKSALLGCEDPYLVIPKLATLYLGKEYEVESAAINAWEKAYKPLIPLIESLGSALKNNDFHKVLETINKIYAKRSWAYQLIHDTYP